MSLFSPYKKHANRFNYQPRFYDPAKEAREQRRAELRGERAEDRDKPYEPGQYIRTQRDARAARREQQAGKSQNRVWLMVAVAVLLVLFGYMIYPRLADVFQRAGRTPVQAEWSEDDFNPYAPITVVPNDYVEEAEE